MNIGEKIRMRRKELGLTTEELGRMIGVQRAAVTKYEKGYIDLKAAQVQAIADALHISPALLLSDADDSVLTPEEHRLLRAYRAADDRARDDALKTLLDHPKKELLTKAK